MKNWSLLPAAVLLFAVSQLQAQDKAALREITAAYEEIEENYKDWPHYTYSAENLDGGHSYQHHVWKSDGDEGFIKVESLNFGDHGETKTQFFFKGADLLFSFDRSETSLMMPKAPTEIHETRCYFADGKLIRQLQKKGKFPAGTKTDTAGIKGKELPPSELESATETYTTQHEIAAQVIERARLLDSDEPISVEK
jgi:hypothetical protein